MAHRDYDRDHEFREHGHSSREAAADARETAEPAGGARAPDSARTPNAEANESDDTQEARDDRSPLT